MLKRNTLIVTYIGYIEHAHVTKKPDGNKQFKALLLTTTASSVKRAGPTPVLLVTCACRSMTYSACSHSIRSEPRSQLHCNQETHMGLLLTGIHLPEPDLKQ